MVDIFYFVTDKEFVFDLNKVLVWYFFGSFPDSLINGLTAEIFFNSTNVIGKENLQ